MFKPRPYPYATRTPGPGADIWDRLRVPARDRTPALAARLGVLTRADVSTEVVWEVRDFNWVTRGHISRTYPDKRIRVWRTIEGPFYGYHGFTRAPILWIVEDNVSAGQIALAGGNALALLGTHFPRDAYGELRDYLRRLTGVVETPWIKVALDPDAAGKGAAMARELTSRLGYATMFVPLVADPKDLPDGELERMVREGP